MHFNEYDYDYTDKLVRRTSILQQSSHNKQALLKETIQYYLEKELGTEVIITPEYVRRNFKRNDKSIKVNSAVPCCCSHNICNLFKLEHRETNIMFLVGSCCINLCAEFRDKQDKSNFWKLECQKCGEKHQNRKFNLCNICKKLHMKEIKLKAKDELKRIEQEEQEQELNRIRKKQEETRQKIIDKLQEEAKKRLLCECGNTKDKETFKMCKECLFKSYKKYYDNCIDCDKPKVKERDREFPRCYNCLQTFRQNI